MIQPYFRNQTLMCTEKVLFEFHYFKVGWPLQSYYTGLFWKLNSHTNISSFNSIYIKLTNFDTWIQQTVVSFSGWFRLLPFSIQSLMILISFYAPWAHAHSLPWSTDQKKNCWIMGSYQLLLTCPGKSATPHTHNITRKVVSTRPHSTSWFHHTFQYYVFKINNLSAMKNSLTQLWLMV